MGPKIYGIRSSWLFSVSLSRYSLSALVFILHKTAKDINAHNEETTSTNKAMNSTVQSVLLIGATGKTGIAVLYQLAKDPSQPVLHVLCRDPAKLAKLTNVQPTSVVKGDARSAKDIERAMDASMADWVIVSVGNGENVAKSDIRTANAKATVSVLNQPKYGHVRVLVVSSTGASSSRIIVGMGIGALITHHLRHVLADHTGQEEAFATMTQSRVTIFRPTALTDNQATGKMVTFDDNVKCPTIKTDRADLAEWIGNEICGDPILPKGGCVNVTSVKKQ
jgi:NADPH:quinone reductase-like Zn-dependent oxidoreductase